MEAQQQQAPLFVQMPRNISLTDPRVIGASALVLGIVIGAGRWQMLGRGLGKVAESLGSLALVHFMQVLQKRNPEAFERVWH